MQPGGAFVTLRIRGRLRGCIGQLASGIALVRVVAYCAKAAALEDPRFEPVRPEEVPRNRYRTLRSFPHLEDIAPDQIEPGRHGLIVSRGAQRGLLLPQVASGISLDRAAFSGRDLRQRLEWNGCLERSCHANSGFHSGGFQ